MPRLTIEREEFACKISATLGEVSLTERELYMIFGLSIGHKCELLKRGDTITIDVPDATIVEDKT